MVEAVVVVAVAVEAVAVEAVAVDLLRQLPNCYGESILIGILMK